MDSPHHHLRTGGLLYLRKLTSNFLEKIAIFLEENADFLEKVCIFAPNKEKSQTIIRTFLTHGTKHNPDMA